MFKLIYFLPLQYRHGYVRRYEISLTTLIPPGPPAHSYCLPIIADEHDIPHPAPSTSNPTSASDSPYAARPAPRTFAEFLAEVNRIAAAATGLTDQTGTAEQGGERNVNGEERVEPDAGGIMVDEDLYEEIFGGEDGIGRK